MCTIKNKLKDMFEIDEFCLCLSSPILWACPRRVELSPRDGAIGITKEDSGSSAEIRSGVERSRTSK